MPHCYTIVCDKFPLFQIKELPEDSSIPKKTKEGKLDLFYVRYRYTGSSFQALFPSEVEEDSEDDESDEEEEEEEYFTSLKKKSNGAQNGQRQNGMTNGHAKTPKNKKSGKETHHVIPAFSLSIENSVLPKLQIRPCCIHMTISL